MSVGLGHIHPIFTRVSLRRGRRSVAAAAALALVLLPLSAAVAVADPDPSPTWTATPTDTATPSPLSSATPTSESSTTTPTATDSPTSTATATTEPTASPTSTTTPTAKPSVKAAKPDAVAPQVIPPANGNNAVITVKVGGDRSGVNGVTALAGVVLGFYDAATGGSAVFTCTSDVDGDCSITVPDTQPGRGQPGPPVLRPPGQRARRAGSPTRRCGPGTRTTPGPR